MAAGSGSWGPHGNPVQFPHSHHIPAPIPSEIPRIDFSGMALGQAEMDSAIQTTSTSKVRRVDVGGCGPLQPPKSILEARADTRRYGPCLVTARLTFGSLLHGSAT